MKIAYVEDEPGPFKAIESALKKRADDKPTDEPIRAVQVRSPQELTPSVLASCDVVLADVYFKEKGAYVPRLSDIIATVKEFEKSEAQEGRTRRLPVIAYTGRGTLKECLKFRGDLLDIWDKQTAEPAYVAWRMEELATRLAQLHPDRFLQEVVAGCPEAPVVGKHIPMMLRRYKERWSEANQIDQTSDVVETILGERDMLEPLGDLWRTMASWEMLGRAVSQTMRGHARHVYNVYWLGYALINHPLLAPSLSECWKRAEAGRPLASEPPMTALNLTWFYAALFHDTAYCIEELGHVTSTAADLVNVFEGLATLDCHRELTVNVEESARVLFEQARLGTDAVNSLTDIIKSSVEQGRPDHGLIAALRMNQRARESRDETYVKVAGDAVALHSCLSKYTGAPVISWDEQPIACLLLVADQLQTWDRERGDRKIREHLSDMAERAELSGFQIEEKPEKNVTLTVTYLSPPHLHLSPHAFWRERQRLEKILREKPQQALAKIARDTWPFQLTVIPFLNTTLLTSDLIFPREG